MKKVNIFLIIEVQVILVLVIYLIIVNGKNPDTQSTQFKADESQSFDLDREVGLIYPLDDDITIGNPDSPLRLIFYSRPDCKYCDEFFEETYPRIKDEYIDQGKVSFSVRFLTHSSKPQSLYITKCAYLANEFSFIDAYFDFAHSLFPELDTTKYRSFMLLNGVPESTFDLFMQDTEVEERILRNASIARGAGVIQTPTMFVGEIKIIGKRDYHKVESLIEEQLN